ncbi:MAG: ATP-binding cassette domain-containing protein [Actinomycetota bacterium]|nr:ATP-binding cassette domain-containing protein [Actinomycetota bacterium]
MIRLEGVSVTYADAAVPTLRDVDLHIEEGELALVVGSTGVGKSTLLGTINGLVPHFTGGRLAGRVTVGGYDTRVHPPREMADVVGWVGQDPLAGFVTDTVEDELAYGMEQLAVPPETMRRRVEETLDLLGIAELRHRPLASLSGGQQQRVAIGSVLTAHPRVLVLDEPTSALDPTAAEEVLAAVTRLVHDLGTTVVIAEHRLERVLQYADRIVHLPGGGVVTTGPPELVMQTCSIAPPVIELGRLAGWSPLRLSVRDARRAARPLREQLEARVVAGTPEAAASPARRPPVLDAAHVTVVYGEHVAVRDVSLRLESGSITALMGRNGSGKSSLLWALQGSGRRRAGSVSVDGKDPKSLSDEDARSLVGLVPQTAADLLYLRTVREECRAADDQTGSTPGTCRRLLDRLVPGIGDEQHPRDLSEGQRLALVLAVQLTAHPPVVLLDEPTRGLDYTAKRHLAQALGELSSEGRGLLVATHDVEFVAACADRVVVMAQGEVIADGPTASVVAASPSFAPQVAKIMAPQEWLTVDQVAAALATTQTGARS